MLNVGFEATSGLKLGNEFVEFKARFGGSSREVTVPVDHVVAIYARENGQGMAFPVPTSGATSRADAAQPAREVTAAPRGLRLARSEPEAQPELPTAGAGHEPPEPPPPPLNRPSLTRIK